MVKEARSCLHDKFSRRSTGPHICPQTDDPRYRPALSTPGGHDMTRESMSAEDIAALINESLRAEPDLREIVIVVVRLSGPDMKGCNWIARQVNTRLNSSPASTRLIEDVIGNAQRHFNLF